MAIEIRELVIKAIVATPEGGGKSASKGKEKEKVQTAQETVDMVNFIIKNQKER
jgi:hypothetical protein